MNSLQSIIARNNTTAADIEGGSFVICDGQRIPINDGIAVHQIDEIENELSTLATEGGLPVPDGIALETESARIIAEVGATVYVVFGTFHREGSYLEGVYSTRAAAEAKRDELLNNPKPTAYDNANVEDWTIQ